MKNKILPQLNYIRAIASIIVCVMHLSVGGNLFISPHPIAVISKYGYLGVFMFFILSGFIICYSIPIRYNYTNTITFLKKRLIRIEPPYILSIVLIVFLNYISSIILHKPENFTFNFFNISFHFFYINNFLNSVNYGYVNPVYWTLGIEFQYYLFVALAFPYLINKTSLSLFLILLAPIIAICVPKHITFVSYLPFFGIGILLFLKNINKINQNYLMVLLFIFLFEVYYCFDFAELAITFLTISIIYFFNESNFIIDYLSKISYSLYLIHVPVGAKIVNFGKSYCVSNLDKIFLLLLAIISSVIFAHLFYLIVEKPFMKLSKKILYENQTINQ